MRLARASRPSGSPFSRWNPRDAPQIGDQGELCRRRAWFRSCQWSGVGHGRNLPACWTLGQKTHGMPTRMHARLGSKRAAVSLAAGCMSPGSHVKNSKAAKVSPIDPPASSTSRIWHQHLAPPKNTKTPGDTRWHDAISMAWPGDWAPAGSASGLMCQFSSLGFPVWAFGNFEGHNLLLRQLVPNIYRNDASLISTPHKRFGSNPASVLQTEDLRSPSVGISEHHDSSILCLELDSRDDHNCSLFGKASHGSPQRSSGHNWCNSWGEEFQQHALTLAEKETSSTNFTKCESSRLQQLIYASSEVAQAQFGVPWRSMVRPRALPIDQWYDTWKDFPSI